jgi:hypothetical protein
MSGKTIMTGLKVVIVQGWWMELMRRRGIGSRSIVAFPPVGGAQ